jgi:hypothetical protein
MTTEQEKEKDACNRYTFFQRVRKAKKVRNKLLRENKYRKRTNRRRNKNA